MEKPKRRQAMQPYRDRYLNPYTDFGFKKLFGTEVNKDLLISFINSLLHGREEISQRRAPRRGRGRPQSHIRRLLRKRTRRKVPRGDAARRATVLQRPQPLLRHLPHPRAGAPRRLELRTEMRLHHRHPQLLLRRHRPGRVPPRSAAAEQPHLQRVLRQTDLHLPRDAQIQQDGRPAGEPFREVALCSAQPLSSAGAPQGVAGARLRQAVQSGGDSQVYQGRVSSLPRKSMMPTRKASKSTVIGRIRLIRR